MVLFFWFFSPSNRTQTPGWYTAGVCKVSRPRPFSYAYEAEINFHRATVKWDGTTRKPDNKTQLRIEFSKRSCICSVHCVLSSSLTARTKGSWGLHKERANDWISRFPTRTLISTVVHWSSSSIKSLIENIPTEVMPRREHAQLGESCS